MPTVTITRTYQTKVDANRALELWRAGKTLRQIAEAIAPGASRMAVSRAIARAKAESGA